MYHIKNAIIAPPQMFVYGVAIATKRIKKVPVCMGFTKKIVGSLVNPQLTWDGLVGDLQIASETITDHGDMTWNVRLLNLTLNPKMVVNEILLTVSSHRHCAICPRIKFIEYDNDQRFVLINDGATPIMSKKLIL